MDRAYEGNETRHLALDLGLDPVVPPHPLRAQPWAYNTEIYKRRNDDIAAAMTTEMGAPTDMSKEDQAGSGSFHIETFIDSFKDFEFIRPLGDHAPTSMVAWEPVGVVALITPWNWPLNQIALKVAPSIAAGTTSTRFSIRMPKWPCL